MGFDEQDRQPLGACVTRRSGVGMFSENAKHADPLLLRDTSHPTRSVQEPLPVLFVKTHEVLART